MSWVLSTSSSETFQHHGAMRRSMLYTQNNNLISSYGVSGLHLQWRELKQPWCVLGTVKNISTHVSSSLVWETALTLGLALNSSALYLSGTEYRRKHTACVTDLPITSWEEKTNTSAKPNTYTEPVFRSSSGKNRQKEPEDKTFNIFIRNKSVPVRFVCAECERKWQII